MDKLDSDARTIMMKLITILMTSLLLICSTSASALDIEAGFFSRDGNNQSPSETTNNNIYIKIFENQWIALMYLPYPYATTVDDSTIAEVFNQARGQTTTSAYLRGKFDRLDERATIQIEKFGYIEDELVFECGSLAPCTIRQYDDYLELVKPGMINEHIMRYNQVVVPQ